MTATQQQSNLIQRLLHRLTGMSKAEELQYNLLKSEPECWFKVDLKETDKLMVMEKLFEKGKASRQIIDGKVCYQYKGKRDSDSLFI